MPTNPSQREPESAMPRSVEVSYACPCGTTFRARIYTTVNVTLEPQLLYQLLAGTLNVATCPNCGRKSASAQPFIYHDMARGLFAYVHPEAELEQEARDELLARLRQVYTLAVRESERLSPPRASRLEGTTPRVRRRTPGEDLARIEPEVPPMQVIFGIEDLVALVDSLLEPEERLGRVALSTRSPAHEERARVTQIARTMADELGCLVDCEDGAEDYIVWIYGPRHRIAALAQALRPQG